MLHLVLQSFLVASLPKHASTGRRIFQGRDAAMGEFPYVAMWGSIKQDDDLEYFDMICTCSILSPTWTLTAAHCMAKPPGLPNNIIYHSSHIPAVRGNYSKVIKAIAHPSYEFDRDDESVSNDICLLSTERIIILQYGIVSALDYKTLIGHEVVIAGHGITNDSSRVDATLDINKPLQVFKGIVSRCRQDDDEKAMNICVSSACGSLAMICGGDSGGPLIHTSGILGVNSMSVNDCNSLDAIKNLNKHGFAHASASILAPVSPVIDWISLTLSSK